MVISGNEHRERVISPSMAPRASQLLCCVNTVWEFRRAKFDSSLRWEADRVMKSIFPIEDVNCFWDCTISPKNGECSQDKVP